MPKTAKDYQARWQVKRVGPSSKLALAQITVEELMDLPSKDLFAQLPGNRQMVNVDDTFTDWETGRHGPDSLTRMADTFRDGWPKGAQMLQDMIDKMAPALPRVTGKRRKRRMGADGSEVDVGRLYDGEYETMFVDHPKQVGFVPRTISLGVDFVIQAAVSAQSLKWTGVQVAVCADLLEKAGYRAAVRLVAPGLSNAVAGDFHLMDVSLKDGRDPLRLDLLALLTVPAISRRYILTNFCFTPLDYEVGRSCGKATNIRGAEKVRWQVDETAKAFGYEAPDIILQVVHDERECLTAIRDTLEICGIYEEERYVEHLQRGA